MAGLPLENKNGGATPQAQGQLYLFMALQPFLLNLGRFLSFLILYTVGRTSSTADQPTRRTTQTQNKRKQTSMP
jgi:hypothetical protein